MSPIMLKKLDWEGDEVSKRVQAAAIKGVNATMGACVITAKTIVRVDTSALQGSIRLEPARKHLDGVRGIWGSFDIQYAFWQEVLPEPRGRAYIRPAADAHYRSLARRIKGYL